MQSLWMIAASLLFACMGVCVKLGSAQFSAAELVFYRGLIALPFLSAYVGISRLSLVTMHWRTHILRGLAGFFSIVLYFQAIAMVPLAMAVTLNYTSPLILAAMLVFGRRERISARLKLALVAGFVGVIFLLQPNWDSGQMAGDVLALASAVTASFAYLNVSKLGELGEPEWRTVFYFSLIATLGGLPWVLIANWNGQPLHAIDTRGWLLLLGVGGFGSMAQLCMTRAYKDGKTMVSASLTYSTVVFASLFGIWLWDEHLPSIAQLGVVLILASGILATAYSRTAPAEQD